MKNLATEWEVRSTWAAFKRKTCFGVHSLEVRGQNRFSCAGLLLWAFEIARSEESLGVGSELPRFDFVARRKKTV